MLPTGVPTRMRVPLVISPLVWPPQYLLSK